MITIASGLPRSGTSLMMQILQAGGIELLTDGIREADENNPKGYYEYEKVKSLMKDNSWLDEAEGKAVKVIAQLLPFLPIEFEYKIIFMERDINEVVHSQNKMIQKLGGNKASVSDDILKKTFLDQVNKLKKFMLEKNIETLFINYNELLKNEKEELAKLNSELGLNIDLDQVANQIDKNLYRSRN